LAALLGWASLWGFFFDLVDLQGFFLVLFIFYTAVKEEEKALYLFWREIWKKWFDSEGFQINNRVSWVAVEEETPLSRVVRVFDTKGYNLVAVMDREGHVKAILSEREVLKALMERGQGACLRELIGGKALVKNFKGPMHIFKTNG